MLPVTSSTITGEPTLLEAVIHANDSLSLHVVLTLGIHCSFTVATRLAADAITLLLV